MTRYFYILMVIALTFLSGHLFCQSGGLDIDLYTIKDGLSQTRVNDVYIDSKGFLWVGTHDGLNKYNGYEFQSFQHQPLDSTSLCNNFINSICEDAYGNLWVATSNGLSRYNRRTEKFTNFYQDVNNPNALIDNAVYYVYVDRNGNIWLKTMEHLSKYDPNTGKFSRFEIHNDIFNAPEDGNYNCIFESHDGKLWIGTKDGLNYFNRDLDIAERFEHKPADQKSISSNRVNDIFEDSDHNLWIATDNGLNRLDLETRSFEKYFYNRANPSKGPVSNHIKSIYEDSEGELWIGTNNGISCYNKKTGKFNNFREFYYDYNSILSASVNSIVEDNSKIIWIGTSQGLVKFDKKPKKFKLYKKANNSIPELSGNSISSIFVDNHNRLWVGTYSFGLNIVDRNNNTVTRYNKNSANKAKRISDNNINAIFQNSLGEIWIGTNNGIGVYDFNTGSFIPFHETSEHVTEDRFNKNKVNCFLEDGYKNVWIGANRGLYRFNLKNKELERFFIFENDSIRIDLEKVFHIVRDKEGYMWLGTNRGLVKYHYVKDEFFLYKREGSANQSSLSSNNINSMCIDQNHDLWIGTSSGLNKYISDSNYFKVYTEKEDGLPNNLIFSIVEDHNGCLWVSTNKGIAKMDTRNKVVKNFDISDGLQGFEFNPRSSFQTKNGEIFFGGISGFNSFFPDSMQFNTNRPPVVITSLIIYSTAGKEGFPLTGNDNIEIPPGYSMFNVEFAALDFTWPEKNLYKYKLIQNGDEGEWIYIGNQHYTTFSNVAPGEYYLKVIASNNDNIWNEEGANIKLIIQTPFWKSNAAIIVYILLSLMMIYGFYLIRTRNLRESNKMLKEKETAAVKIKEQKEELTIQNKAITDSIIYAKRIQQALLPSVKNFENILPNSFVYHKPKDIVSGDFYWVSESDDKIFVAAVDCTGHGVPGAFMSIIGFELFRNITMFRGIERPGEILTSLNKDFEGIFDSVGDLTLRDGMDLAFCAFHKDKNVVEFAGAYNPLFIARDNKIMEIKADRFSIGLDEYGSQLKSFTNQEVKLNKGDVIYIFSDGFADQFGGPDGKKYKYRRFRHLLLTIHKLPPNEQLAYIEKSMQAWKGEFEQVDDILLIGIVPEIK